MSLMILVGVVSGADTFYPNYQKEATGKLLGGEHVALVLSGTMTLYTGVNDTTDWLQVNPDLENFDYTNDNQRLFHINPGFFTFSLTLDPYNEGDSVGLTEAYFETAWDNNSTDSIISTSDVYDNPDSSNVFIKDGNYDRADYGIWTFEDFAADTASAFAHRGLSFPLRVLTMHPYLRFILHHDVEDTVIVNWMVECAH